MQRMCGTGCHAIQAVTKHRMSPQRWEQVVDNMVVRGAVGTPAEIDLVVRYLARHFAGPDPEGTVGPASRAAAGSPDAAPRGLAPAGAAGPAPAVEVAADARRTRRLDGRSTATTPAASAISPLTQLTPGERCAAEARVDAHVAATGAGSQPRDATGQAAGASVSAPRLPGELAPETSRLRAAAPRPHVTGHATRDQRRDVSDDGGESGAGARAGDRPSSIWQYDIKEDMGVPALRGLAYWPGDGVAPPTIFFGTSGGFLVALERSHRTAGTADSPRSGVLNLREG